MIRGEVSFKIGPFHRPMSVRVDEDGISTVYRNRTSCMSFSDVSDVFVSEVGPHGMWTAYLRFVSRDDVLVFGVSSIFGLFGGKENLREFYRAVSMAFRALSTAKPSVMVSLGAGRRSNARNMTFAFVMVVVIWLFNVYADKHIELVEYAVLLLLVGAIVYMLLTTHNIFRDPPRITPAEAAVKFEELART